MIIKTKKEIASYVSTCPVVRQCKQAYNDDEGFREIEAELVRLIVVGNGSPDFGEDWETYLTDNIGELLDEAISIIA